MLIKYTSTLELVNAVSVDALASGYHDKNLCYTPKRLQNWYNTED